MKIIKSDFITNRRIEDFSGDSLMIGCGEAKMHHFSLCGSGISGKKLHPAQHFYHVSLPSDYSQEGCHDLEGDFLDEKVIQYLSQKKFNFICFEVVTEIFSAKNSINLAIQHAKKLLSENGVCFIFYGGRDLKNLDKVIDQFKYSYSAKYGFNSAWSLLGSEAPFELTGMIEKNSYLNYIINHVIKKKTGLSLSCNIEEKEFGKKIKSIQEKDYIKFYEIYNPFALYNGAAAQCRFLNHKLASEEEEPAKAYAS